MTETTKESDLKVAIDGLKHSCLRLNKYQHRATVDIEDVELVLTAFEAERQRADELNINWDAAKNAIQFYKAELEVERQQREAAEGEPDGYIFCHPTGKLFWSIVSETCAGDQGVHPYYFTRPLKAARIADLEERLRYTEEALIAATDLHRTVLKGDQVPVSAEFFSDGKWWPFSNAEHKENTIAAGYPVRELFTAAPKPVVLPGISELIDACDSTPAVRDVHVWDLAISEVKRLNPSLFSDKSADGIVVKDGE